MKRFLTTLFGSPLMVFDNDGGAGEANNPNADGGNTEANTGQGGGGGGSNTNTTNNETTHEVTIDGEKRQLTTPELIALASKSGGADKRFQEAAEIKKQAERGLRIQQLVDTIGDGEPTESDVSELAGLLQVDSREFMDYLNEDPNANNNNQNTNTNKNTNKQTPTPPGFDEQFEKVMGMKPAEVKAILQHSTTRHVDDARKEIKDFCKKAVDKDEIIGKMIVGEDSEKVLKAVNDMVAEDVLQKIQSGVPFGTELVTASVERTRQKLTELGIPKRLNQQPIVLGLGPGGGQLPAEIQADEPIERISSVDDKDESNLVNRYMQKAVQDIRKLRQQR